MGCEPASGKTVAVLSKFHILKNRNKANFLIVVVPKNSIKPSFVRTGKNVFGLNSSHMDLSRKMQISTTKKSSLSGTDQKIF